MLSVGIVWSLQIAALLSPYRQVDYFLFLLLCMTPFDKANKRHPSIDTLCCTPQEQPGGRDAVIGMRPCCPVASTGVCKMRLSHRSMGFSNAHQSIVWDVQHYCPRTSKTSNSVRMVPDGHYHKHTTCTYDEKPSAKDTQTITFQRMLACLHPLSKPSHERGVALWLVSSYAETLGVKHLGRKRSPVASNGL